MPHQCVRCNTFYDSKAEEILKGCPCGAKLFFFVKKEQIEKSKNLVVSLSNKEKQQIEHDVLDIIGESTEKEDAPVVLDAESIRVRKAGQYDIDLAHLFKKDPLVYKMGEGKYIIDLIRSLEKKKESVKKPKKKKK